MQRKRMLLAFVVIFMMFGLIAVYTYVSYASLRPKDGTICEGVTVEHVAVGDKRPGDGSGQRRDGKTGKTGIGSGSKRQRCDDDAG